MFVRSTRPIYIRVSGIELQDSPLRINLELASAAPGYTVAFIVNCAMSAMTIVFAVVLRFHLRSLNRKLDRGVNVADVGSSARAVNNREEHGLPGVAIQRGFRFLL